MRALTLKQAKALKHGDVVYHRTINNVDGTPKRLRVVGAVKTWKRDSSRVRVPVKHGLYDTGCITNGTSEGNRFTLHLNEVSLG